MNLRHMSFKEALCAAKKLSGLDSNEAIAGRSGYDLSSVTRYFQATDKYCPSAEKIPGLCRALGNTLLIEWQLAQVEDLTSKGAPIRTPGQVASCALKSSAFAGDISVTANTVIEDGEVTPEEARVMQDKHRTAAEFHMQKAAEFEELARITPKEWKGDVMRGEKWKRAGVSQ